MDNNHFLKPRDSNLFSSNPENLGAIFFTTMSANAPLPQIHNLLENQLI